VVILLQDRPAFEAIEKICDDRFEAVYAENRGAIGALSSGRREPYRRLRRQAK